MDRLQKLRQELESKRRELAMKLATVSPKATARLALRLPSGAELRVGQKDARTALGPEVRAQRDLRRGLRMGSVRRILAGECRQGDRSPRALRVEDQLSSAGAE